MRAKNEARKLAPMHVVLHKAEILLYLSIVVYFLYVLTSEGAHFCQRLVQHGITVPGLRPGAFGTHVDVSDQQWREFRASMLLLSAVLGGFVACSRAVQAVAPEQRATFYVVFSLIFLAVLHGSMPFVRVHTRVSWLSYSQGYCWSPIWPHCCLGLALCNLPGGAGV